MIKPTIHLNGTSATTLVDGYRKAGRALQAAIKALEECAPNARDYYPQGLDVYQAAVKEHQGRIEAINGVCRDIYALHMHAAGEDDGV